MESGEHLGLPKGETLLMTSLIQHIVSVILFFVMFFGLAFILNMLLRRTWLMSFVYPVIILLIVGKLNVTQYITKPVYAFSTAFSNLMNITLVDTIILSSGFAGTIVSGIVIKILRRSGYQMF